MCYYYFETGDYRIVFNPFMPMDAILGNELLMAQFDTIPEDYVATELAATGVYSWPEINSADRETNEARLLAFAMGGDGL
jgi:hypothetical protein